MYLQIRPRRLIPLALSVASLLCCSCDKHPSAEELHSAAEAARLEHDYEQMIRDVGNQEEDEAKRRRMITPILQIDDSKFVRIAISHSRDTAIVTSEWHDGPDRRSISDSVPSTLTVGGLCSKWLYTYFGKDPRFDPVENWSEWLASMKSKGISQDQLRKDAVQHAGKHK